MGDRVRLFFWLSPLKRCDVVWPVFPVIKVIRKVNDDVSPPAKLMNLARRAVARSWIQRCSLILFSIDFRSMTHKQTHGKTECYVLHVYLQQLHHTEGKWCLPFAVKLSKEILG